MSVDVSETALWLNVSQPQPVDLRGQRVTAILVVRNGAPWLADTLTALSRLTFRPALVIAVDNRSEDTSGAMLEQARLMGIVDAVLEGSATASFGEAVAQAVKLIPPGNQWLWFLHDDAAPDPNALAYELALALRTPNLQLVYPLLVRPTRRRHTPLTLELGASISGTGRRHLTIEPGEAAQGQYDPETVLGGSTCGLLISQAAYENLHGFSSAIPNYRDGLDLGWRANLAGYGVMSQPDAQFIHHQAGRSERRTGTIAQTRHRSETAWDRLMGMRLVAAHTTGLARIGTWLKLVFAALLRALGYLLDKAPDQSRDEIQALGDFVRSGSRVRRLRARLAHFRPTTADLDRIDSLRPPWHAGLTAFWHTLTDLVRSSFSRDTGSDLMLDDLLGDEFESRASDRPQRIPRWVWGLLLCVLAVISVRTLFTTGTVRAEHLLGAPATLAQAFQTALASPAGTSSPPAPWLLLEAIFSIPFVHPNWFVVAVLALAVPFTTAVAAWFLRHHLGQRRRMSWVLAVLYALLPVLLGGLNRGELWLVLLAVMLPFFVAWLSRWQSQTRGVKAWQPAAGIAVALTLVVPLVPILWLPAAVAVFATAWRARSGAAGWIRAVLAVILPVVIWGDWLWSLLGTPGRYLTAPAPLLGQTTTTPAWQMLLGRIQAGGLPPLWVSAVAFGAIWLAAAIAIARRPHHGVQGVAGLVFLTVGVALSRFTVAIDTSRSMPDAAPWLLLGFATLLLVVANYLGEGSQLANRDFGLGQALIGAVSVLLALVTALSLAWWAWGGVTNVTRGDTSDVPYFVAQGEVTYGASTLIIDQSAEVARWSLRSGGQPSWGQGETRTGALASTEAWSHAQQVVAQVEAGRYDDALTAGLVKMGVRYVVLISPRPDSAGALEAATGLGRGSASNDGQAIVYQVLAQPTSIQVVSLDGTGGMSLIPASSPLCDEGNPSCRVTEAGSDSLLVLSQPDDPGLVVTVGGAELQRAESPDWRAAFSLEGAQLCTAADPAESDCGRVVVTSVAEHRTWRYVQLALGFLMVLFALPSATQRAAAARSPRRAQGEEAE